MKVSGTVALIVAATAAPMASAAPQFTGGPFANFTLPAALPSSTDSSNRRGFFNFTTPTAPIFTPSSTPSDDGLWFPALIDSSTSSDTPLFPLPTDSSTSDSPLFPFPTGSIFGPGSTFKFRRNAKNGARVNAKN